MIFLVKIIRKIIDTLFPDQNLSHTHNYDFSKIPPLEFKNFAKRLPFAVYPPQINLKIKHGVKNEKTTTSCLLYKNPFVQSLIWNIKNKKDRGAIACAGYILSEKLKEILREKSSDIPIIIPIPIHHKRRRERGYNQCELLAYEIKKYHQVEIRTDILSRTSQRGKEAARKQAFKKRSERISEMKDAFTTRLSRSSRIENLKNRNVIIIDDVLTTGSTMNEAILTLRKAGFKNIHGLALAH